MNESSNNHDHGGIEKQKQGITSFGKNNTELIFKELDLNQGDYFLDIGCGAGDYTIQAAKIIGSSGLAYALDKWAELEPILEKKTQSENLKNIKTIVADITGLLPVEDKSIDVSLIAFVLHGMDKSKDLTRLFPELKRITKPGGRVAFIELKKDLACDTHPIEILFSPDEIEALIKKYNFQKTSYIDLERNYMVQFKLKEP